MDFKITLIDSLYLWSTFVGVLSFAWLLCKLFSNLLISLKKSIFVSYRIDGQVRYGFTETDRLYYSLLTVFQPSLSHDFSNRCVELKEQKLSNGKESYTFNRDPGYGVQYFRYHGCFFRIERRQQPELNLQKVPFENLTITTFFWNKEVLDEALVEAKERQRSHDEEKTSFFISSCDYWKPFGVPKQKRSLDTVITDAGVKEKILKDVQDFLASEEWYLERGIPYRRGYLLYGPPGSGKSSLIRAIAGEIGYDICIMTLSCKDLTDDALNYLMNSTPENCIILLEDVDAAFKSREVQIKDGNSEDEQSDDKANHLAFGGSGCSKVTFRGLLNAIDGVASTEGRLIFITTNYPDKLDPALIRPGRADVKVLVDYPSEDQIEKMFRRFYTKCSDNLVAEFVKKVISMKKKVSMAGIQGLFLMFKNEPEAAIRHADDYFNNAYFSKKDDPSFEAEEKK